MSTDSSLNSRIGLLKIGGLAVSNPEGVRAGLVGLAEVSRPDEQVRAAARKRAEELGWDSVAATYLRLFERLLREGTPGR